LETVALASQKGRVAKVQFLGFYIIKESTHETKDSTIFNCTSLVIDDSSTGICSGTATVADARAHQ
jgi:hypothetical protein